MSARYTLTVERIGPAGYHALLFRGERLLSDVKAHRPDLALHQAVEHTRWLRRTGWIRKECA